MYLNLFAGLLCLSVGVLNIALFAVKFSAQIAK